MKRYCGECPIPGECPWRIMCVPLEGTRVGRALDNADPDTVGAILYPYLGAGYFVWIGFDLGGWWWLFFGPFAALLLSIGIGMTLHLLYD